MALPALYRWVEEIPNLPKMIAEAIKLVGIKEYPGKARNNPTIMAMASDLRIASIYPNDETAWCALVQSWLCWKTGKPMPGKNYALLRAFSFTTWGVDARIPMFGDTMVFDRDGGYHVGFYIGEDETHYHIMGGNQRNSYSIMRLEKERRIACRRYYSIAPPACVKPVKLAPNGVVSINEA